MKDWFVYNGRQFEYDVIKSSRKSVGIKLNEKGEITVRAPKNLSLERIKEIVLSKAAWIVKKLDIIREHNKEYINNTYESGQQLRFLGNEYILELITNEKEKNPVQFNGNYIGVYIGREDYSKEKIKSLLLVWYREEALKYFKIRVEHYKNLLNVQPGKIKEREQKSCWGSCSKDNNINLNWKLIMAPAEIVDYVIVHELCHIKERNHSRDFWNLVEKILPDYKIRRNWLKSNGVKLII